MNTDDRLAMYTEAAAAMRHGDFHLKLSVEPLDQVGSLGRELQNLAHGLERRFAEFDRLMRLNRDLNSGLLLEEVLEHVYASFKGVIPYDRIGFALLEDGGKTLRAHWVKMEYAYPCLKRGFSAPMEGSSLQAILKTGCPRIINDLQAYHAGHPQSASTRLMIQEGIRSSLTCPLILQGRSIGFMFFSSRFAETYEAVHVDTFVQVAGTVSAVVEKSRLYGELVELGKLKNTFLGMAAHDLRGPLGNIAIYADLLSSGDIRSEEERAAALADIGQIAEAALKMVESLLDVTAIEAGAIRIAPKPTDVRAFLARVCERASLSGRKKGIAVNLVVAPELPAEFVFDADRIEQALMNLLSNAFKFSAQGTRVLLMARLDETGALAFGVHDEGPGMSASARQGLFADYAKSEARPTGGEKSTGLGLAIVKRIVEAHRGEVRVASLVGAGSAFMIRLPKDGGAP